jgi:quercetin dioxygenase-like cupin family protein
MKLSLATSAAAACIAVLAVCASPVFAIDLVEAAPKQTKVLVDNDKVRVMEVRLAKGDKIPMHSHPDMVVYIIQGGRTKWTSADGKVTETTAKDGETFFRPAVTHAHEHLDAGHAIVVVLKK